MLKQGSPQEWSAEKTNSGRNKTDEFWLCHCFISLCRKAKVSLLLKHRADLQGTTEWTEEYHVCPTRRPSGPRGRSGSSKVIKCLVFQITPSCIRLPERLFSAFRKKKRKSECFSLSERETKRKNQSSRWWVREGWLGVCYSNLSILNQRQEVWCLSWRTEMLQLILPWGDTRQAGKVHQGLRWSCWVSLFSEQPATEGDTHDK